MKHTLSKLALALAASAFATASMAATATANTTAEVVDNLAITAVNDLDFGTVTKTGSAYTKLVAAADGASFTVVGTEGLSYTVDAEATPLVGPGTATMTVSNIVVVGNDSLSGAEDELSVGATLNVGAGQDAGSYTGELTLTVAYAGEEEEDDGPGLPPIDPPVGP